MVKKSEKVKYLADLYGKFLQEFQTDEGREECRIFNSIIIDSLGVMGLKKVKQLAWKFKAKKKQVQNDKT